MRDHRRLAAIVSADVAGYSRLMGVDDSGTLAALKAHRRELIDPKIAEYGGRIVKTTGDGLLLEFPSVVDAVRCAVDVQRGMAERAAAIDPPGGGYPQLLTCKSYLYLGRYEDAVTACEKSAGLNNSWIDQVYLIAAYAQKGDVRKAKVAKDELLKLQPGYTIERYRETWYSGTPAFFDLVDQHLAAGLRKAGIPEK